MNDGICIDLTFDDVTVGNVPVTWVGEDLFRLEGSPFVEDAFYQDVIQVEKVSDDSYIFQKVVKPSGRKNYCYLLHKAIHESPGFEELLKRIEDHNGYWEQACGGILVVSLAPESGFNLPKEIVRLNRSLGIE